MFKVGDIVIPSMNNAESAFENPIPKYKIFQIGMGRVFAENLKTGEYEDLAGVGDIEYYYELLWKYRKLVVEILLRRKTQSFTIQS